MVTVRAFYNRRLELRSVDPLVVLRTQSATLTEDSHGETIATSQ